MPQAYFIREAYFILRSNISLVPKGTNFIEKEKTRFRVSFFFWRHHPDLNRGIKVLQTSALPLGYGAIFSLKKDA